MADNKSTVDCISTTILPSLIEGKGDGAVIGFEYGNVFLDDWSSIPASEGSREEWQEDTINVNRRDGCAFLDH